MDDMVNALKQGDNGALAKIFETYADKIYRLAAGVLHDEVQADGVVQDTFVALIEHIDTFEGRSDIGTWLYRVAYNESLGRLRKSRHIDDMDITEDDDVMPACFVDWNEVPDNLLSNQEAADQMTRAIQSLAPNLCAVFTLRDVEGLSTRETAAALGISEAAVKVRLHRARLALREMLAAYFEEYINDDTTANL